MAFWNPWEDTQEHHYWLKKTDLLYLLYKTTSLVEVNKIKVATSLESLKNIFIKHQDWNSDRSDTSY